MRCTMPRSVFHRLPLTQERVNNPVILEGTSTLTTNATDMSFARSRLFTEITGILRDIVRSDGQDAGVIGAGTRLEGDLRLDSIEMATLAARLRERYGPRVDLLGFLATLELDELIGLTVGQLVERVAERTG
jgi:acyl carrier protein